MNEQESAQAREIAIERTARDIRDVLSAVGRGGAGHLLTGSGGSEAILSLAGDLYVGHLSRARLQASVDPRKVVATRTSETSAPDSKSSGWIATQNTSIAVIRDDVSPSPFAVPKEDEPDDRLCGCHPASCSLPEIES